MKRKILLVEDDVPLRKQIRFLLEKDYQIFEASNKKEAEITLKQENIDVVVIDLGLPPFEDVPDEGLSLVNKLSNINPAKLIVLTGQKGENAAKEALKMGVFDYLIKPVDPTTLLKSIERAMFFRKIEEKLEKEGFKSISITTETKGGVKSVREEAEKRFILKVLKETGFNVYRASKILGVKRENLYYFMKKFGIKRESD